MTLFLYKKFGVSELSPTPNIIEPIYIELSTFLNVSI